MQQVCKVRLFRRMVKLSHGAKGECDNLSHESKMVVNTQVAYNIFSAIENFWPKFNKNQVYVRR